MTLWHYTNVFIIIIIIFLFLTLVLQVTSIVINYLDQGISLFLASQGWQPWNTQSNYQKAAQQKY